MTDSTNSRFQKIVSHPFRTLSATDQALVDARAAAFEAEVLIEQVINEDQEARRIGDVPTEGQITYYSADDHADRTIDEAIRRGVESKREAVRRTREAHRRDDDALTGDGGFIGDN